MTTRSAEEIRRQEFVGSKRLVVGDGRKRARRPEASAAARRPAAAAGVAPGRRGEHARRSRRDSAARGAACRHRRARPRRCRALAPAARKSGSGSTRIAWSACGRLDQRLVAGQHHVGAERRGERRVRAGVGGRLGEDDVEADRLGAGLAQRLDQPGMQAARPRPLQADLGEGGLVDRHDDRARRSATGGATASRNSRRRAPRPISTARSVQSPTAPRP